MLHPARAGALVDAAAVALVAAGIDGGHTDTAGDHHEDREHLHLVATAATGAVVRRLLQLIGDAGEVDLDEIAADLDAELETLVP